MANTDNAFGLRPVRWLGGADWNGKGRPYYLPSGYAVNVFIGDPVVIVGDSNDAEVEIIGGGVFEPGSLSEVNLATGTDGTYITGVVVGFHPTTRESTIYGAASTERVALVCDDPNVVFQIQDDGTGSLGVDTVGLNAELVSGAGSTSTGLSGWELDGGGTTAPSADASNTLLILNASNLSGNDVTADYCIWDVLINMHTYRATGDGDGSLGVA